MKRLGIFPDSDLSDYMKSHRQRAITNAIAGSLPQTSTVYAERELTPEREAEVREKFRRFAEMRKAQAFLPEFPPYVNLVAPKGCTHEYIQIVNDYWMFLGKRYIVEFTFEIVYGSKNGKEKKIRSMQKKMEAMLKLCSGTELTETPGFVVKEWKEVENV